MTALLDRFKSPQFKAAFKDYVLAIAASAVSMGVALILNFAPEYAVAIGALTGPIVRWADKNAKDYGRGTK